MCTHCKSSALYRSARIAEHTVQFRATMLVIGYFVKRYRSATLARHQERAIAAIQHLEERFDHGKQPT